MDVKSLANEAYTLALKDTLDGMTHTFPNIKNALFFNESGDIIAMDDKTSEESAVHTVDALDEILDRTDILGSLENVALEGTEGWLNVSRFDDLFLVTTVPSKADLERATAFADVLVPTVLKVLRRVHLAPVKENLEELEVEHEEPPTQRTEEKKTEFLEQTRIEKRSEESAPETTSKPVMREPQVNQFIVENLGGMFSSSDTVRIDNDLLLKWKEMYDDREIEEVKIATFGGKSVRCKVKPVKDAKLEGKGSVQIHEKTQSALQIKKGELVRVTPIIE